MPWSLSFLGVIFLFFMFYSYFVFGYYFSFVSSSLGFKALSISFPW